MLVSVQVQVLVLCGAWKAPCGSALGTAALKFLVLFVGKRSGVQQALTECGESLELLQRGKCKCSAGKVSLWGALGTAALKLFISVSHCECLQLLWNLSWLVKLIYEKYDFNLCIPLRNK